MKKYIKYCVMCVMVFMAILIMSGCKPKIEKGYVKTGSLATTIVRGEILDTNNVIATFVYSDDSTIEVGSKELEFSDFSSDVVGTKKLTITYNDFSFDVNIKIVATEADVSSITSLSSRLIDDYNERRNNQENLQEQFIYQNEPIYVGDDNLFDFRIFATGIDGSGDLQTDLTKVRTNITIKLETGNGSQIIEENEVEKYVNIDTENTTLDFTEDAIGKDFEVEVSAKNVNELYVNNPTSFTTILRVVDGYNVYNATDLSVYDNYHTSFDNIRPTNNKVNSIILQDDIFVTKDDVRQDAFWTTIHPNYNIVKDLTDQDVVGTPIDYASTGIYHRQLLSGERFNFYGNYFKIDLSKFPKMVVESDDGGSGKHGVKKENGNEDYMTSHLCLFYNENISEVSATNKVTLEPSILNYENIYFYGNGALNNQPENSGALTAYKVFKTNFHAKNNITHNFYIANFFSHNEDIGDKEGYNVLESCKAFNSYQTLVYSWGCKNLKMIDCEYKFAGGPAIIADHVGADEDNGGYPSYIDCINCEISSIVSGQEPWFVTYGADSLVMQLMTTDELFTGLRRGGMDNSQMVANGLPQNGKTIVAKNIVNGGSVDCVNLMFAMKSGSAQGLTTEQISGYVRMFDNVDEYNSYYRLNGEEFANTTYGLDMTKDDSLSLYNKALTAGVLYFENNKGGGYINSNVANNFDGSFVKPVTLYTITRTILNTDSGTGAKNQSVIDNEVNAFRVKNLTQMKESLKRDLLTIKNAGAISLVYDNAINKHLLSENIIDATDDLKYERLIGLVDSFVMHTDGRYVNIYLFNGMGAMIELFPIS